MRTNLFYKKQPLLGLDIGTHNTKVAQVKRGGKEIKIVGYGMAAIPDGVIVEGIITDPGALAEPIIKLLRGGGWGRFTARQVVTALPESRVFTRIIKLPLMSEAQLAEAIHWETQQYIPMPIDDIYTDYQVVSTDGSGKDAKQNILLVAAPRAIVDSYIKLFEILNLGVYGIEISLSAVIRAIILPQFANQSTLVIDFGSMATDLAIHNQIIRLTSSIPIGGDHLTESLVKKLKIERDKATEIKHRFGIAPSGMQAKIVPAINAQLSSLAAEFKKIIKYYEERSEGGTKSKVEKIILCGGGASLPGLIEFMQKDIKLPIEIGNPWQKIALYPLKPIPKEIAPVYATAIGLALQEVKYD